MLRYSFRAGDELEDQIIGREDPRELVDDILRDVVELLRQHHLADEMLKTDESAARLAATTATLEFLTRTAARLQGLPGFPAQPPGETQRRLHATAFEEAERNANPKPPRRGRPPLSLNDQLDRVRPAVAVELLLAAGYSLLDAAKEVADRLPNHTAEAILDWRERLQAEPNSIAGELFNALFAEVSDQVAARGMTANAYVKVIEAMFDKKNSNSFR